MLQTKSPWKKNMKGVTIDGAVIGVNIAKYDRWEMKSNDEDGSVALEAKCNLKSSSSKQDTRENIGDKDQGWSGNASFKDVLVNWMHSGTNSKGKHRTVLLDPEDTLPEKLWNSFALCGKVMKFEDIVNLTSILVNLGLKIASIKYLGGLSVMCVLDSAESVNTFLLEKKELWSKVFSELQAWDNDYLVEDRIAWLNIRGVLAGLWDSASFDLIGNSFGKVVESSCVSVFDSNLTVGRVCILLRSFDKIDEYISLKRKNKVFRIHVLEDNLPWVPDFRVGNSPEVVVQPTPRVEISGCHGINYYKGSMNLGHGSRILVPRRYMLG